MTKLKHTRDSGQMALKAVHEAKNSLEGTLSNLQANLSGLTNADAKVRIQTYGFNEVAHDKAPSFLVQLLLVFKNPFIFVLLILAGMSFFTDYLLPLRAGEETELAGIVIILTMVTLSGLLRFWQEYRSNKAAEALKSMIRTTVTVQRRPT